MDAKYNHRHLNIQANRTEPRQPVRHDRPSHRTIERTSHDASENTLFVAQPTEQEVTSQELSTFCFHCLEQLTLGKNKLPVKEIISSAIDDKLGTYTRLKNEMYEALQQQQAHHKWAKKLYQTVEPLLKGETAAHEEQQNLSEFTTRCVERDLQLHYRTVQLRKRVVCLEQAVTRHLVSIGQEIGLPDKLVQKLARLLKDTMHASMPHIL